ncbi:MAG TPA: 4-(cytidine 5'-diphospho)-2-C-methyl-D-erythritol kinase, partial [Chitinophagaceae bacterium]|nr:4-(cytidine 5'-diphospho)-2-C-methyl-D-erythritol kinase [Chitinophagaceae bacterium]
DNQTNSCLQAYGLLKKFYPGLPPVQMHLHKAIPIGGGLGGGSADAAFTLLLLNKKFNLDISEEMLLQYALELGSDCPFFIKNTPCLATGRGEVLQPFSLDLSAYKMVLVNPGIHINTGWAFTKIKLEGPQIPLSEIMQLPVAEWKIALFNVFEKPIFEQHPTIKEAKEQLYQNGAVYASMSGSGATVYGLFKKETPLHFQFPGHYLVKEC